MLDTRGAPQPEAALISILLPTRGRPDSLSRMLDSLFGLADRPDRVEAVVRIDDDDAATLALDLTRWPVRRLVGARLPMALLNTACLDAAAGDILLAANDDIVVRTKGWDTRMRAAAAGVPDGVYLLYPNDLIQGARLATFPGFSRAGRRLLGEPFPRAYRGEFIDVHLKDIFERLKGRGHDRLLFLEDVVFEHLHHRAGKMANDATYRERENTVDDRVFLELQPSRAAAARRLLAHIAGAPATAAEPPPAVGSFLTLTLGVLLKGSAPALWRLRVFSWLWRRHLNRYRQGGRTSTDKAVGS